MLQQKQFKRPVLGSVQRTGVFATAVLATLLAASVGCSKEPAEKEQPVAVQIVPVEKKTIEHTIVSDAVLFPLAQSAITSKISAPVKTFYVKRGSRVHKGELLATLENMDLSAAAQDAKGSFDQAESVYKTTTAGSLPEELRKAELDDTAARELRDAQEKVYKSRQDLFQQGALPRKELDQSLVDYTQARNQADIADQHLAALQKFGNAEGMKGAAGQLESAKGKYLGAEAQLGYSEVRSPIDGVVTDRPLYPGEMAAAGTPLLTVMNTSSVIARAHIPQREAQLLKTGNSATIRVPGEDKTVEGKVTLVSPALDPNSTTVEIWVEAKNSGALLKPGASVQLSIVAKTIADAMVVPAVALQTAADGTTSVMIAGTDGRAHQKTVTAGIQQDDDIQIVDGLKEGDKVVASGAYGLPDNAKIVQAEAADAKDDSADKDKAGAKDSGAKDAGAKD